MIKKPCESIKTSEERTFPFLIFAPVSSTRTAEALPGIFLLPVSEPVGAGHCHGVGFRLSGYGVPAPTEKQCPKCKIIKPIETGFPVDKTKSTGRGSHCKLCKNKKNRETRSNRLEEYREKDAEKHRRHHKYPKKRFLEYKRSARIRNIDWNLTFEEFMTFWQKPCFYCGNIPETIGLDRIDSSKGYSLSNIDSCCIVCNRTKKERSKEDYIIHCCRAGVARAAKIKGV